MGTYNKGILGAFSGKVGPVVGASWRGKDVMRSLPRRTSRLATATQITQRNKFAMTTEFLSKLSPVVSRYFGNNTGDKTRRNQAMSYHIKEAIVLVGQDLEWDFSKVLISKGDLIGLNAGVATAGVAQTIDLAWIDNSGQGEAQATDKMVVAVYEETTKTMVTSLNAGLRNQSVTSLVLPTYFTGLSVQVWATFVDADDKLFATSHYLGTVTVN